MVLLFMKHKKMFKRKEETVIKNELFNQRFKGGIHSIWLSEYPVSGHQNIRHPVIRISGIRSSEYLASGYQNIRHPVIRISGIRSSEYPASGYQNIRHPVIRLSDIRLSDYPISGYQNIRHPAIRISGIRSIRIRNKLCPDTYRVAQHQRVFSGTLYSLSLVVESLIQERSFFKGT